MGEKLKYKKDTILLGKIKEEQCWHQDGPDWHTHKIGCYGTNSLTTSCFTAAM